MIHLSWWTLLIAILLAVAFSGVGVKALENLFVFAVLGLATQRHVEFAIGLALAWVINYLVWRVERPAQAPVGIRPKTDWASFN
jgi:hypothetical protein